VFRRSALLALAAVFAALAGLVASGALRGLDQWALDHVMPGASPGGGKPTLLEAVVPLVHSSWSSWPHVVANLVTLPAQGIVSLLILLAVRDARWLAAWLAGNLVELLCKSLIVRPPLFLHHVHLAGFDSSWPSGHSLRSVVLAVALAMLWPRARVAFAAWAAATLLLLVAAGHHVPSDVAGGLVLGLLACGGAAGALRGRRLAGRARR
jgi:membrane-associated phospholipid phosphatase